MDQQVKRVKRELVKNGAILDIYTDTMQLPDGKLELVFKRLGNKSSRFNIAVADGKDKDIGRMNGIKIYMSTDTLNVNLPLDKNANIHNAILKLEDAKTKEEIFRHALQL